MKMLLVAPELYTVPSPTGTSVETCMLSIATQLAKRHNVTLVCKKSAHLRHTSVHGKLQIDRLPGETKRKYVQALGKYVRGKAFDVVQVDNRPHIVPFIKQRVRSACVALFLHSLTYVTPPKASIDTVERQLRFADVIMVNSESLKRELVRLYPKQAQKIHVVRLGVDLKQFRPATAGERKSMRANYNVARSFVVLYTGRLIPIKGVDVLIRAVALVQQRIPQTKLVIVGTGKKDYIARLKRIAKRLHVHADFVGVVQRKVMHQMYWLADCFVCPSQGHESFGLVVVEALASGVPVVASQNGGMTEIIRQGENGLLVHPYRRPQSFAQAIERIGKDSQLARTLAKKGRHTCATRFRWEQTADRLAKIYASARRQKKASW